MTDRVLDLRGLTDAGTADYSIANAPYWSDDHMQAALDRHCVNIRGVEMQAVQVQVVGGYEYKEYLSGFTDLESAVTIKDGQGAEIGTALYSVDYAKGVVTFTTDQGGSARYLTGRAFSMNAAAADVWRMKAAHASSKFDFATDGHSVKRSQLVEMALKMAEHYEQQNGGETVEIFV
ncbi:MAG: hypothetical protein KIT08_01320 [Anaerolineales bacterium]|nr:MAG: hypothetical protein KIT08_01320 [Anaerolineales bacterium]